MIEPFLARDLVHQALNEDLLYGDQTTDALFQESFDAIGDAVAKEDMVVAGLDLFETVFKALDPALQFEAASSPGQRLKSGDLIARVSGDGRSILKGERTALNFLQRLSGIATLTRAFVSAVEGTRAQVVDTRKTTPGWRALEKKAVRLGGGGNHRFHLGDMVLIKDNHIALSGGIKKAVEKVRSAVGHPLKIEVEVGHISELHEALASQVEIIMLDNMTVDEIQTAVTVIREKDPNILIEVSGGVRLETVGAMARCGADLISVGALTHSARAMDISLEMS
ncbi:MAG: carboxylating nicotinate-nucleotide diphosphorylase [Nitrospiria bacterium]